ncbi:MAG: nicotinate phosphoribosyltransferase [Myxococcaceae bacterium]|nr:nicotinate phosphoribosyltransferase [Myxococcaceae bacterium]
MAASLLMTDGYKFSMAEAGWPLRRETFYWSHRKGGAQVLPFDARAEVAALLPSVEEGELKWLAENGYECGPGLKAALSKSTAVSVHALPKGAVFYPREPILSVTGPSALVSWLEPLVLTWNWRVQVASVARFAPEQLSAAVGVLTCERQKELTLEALDAVGVKAPNITVDPDGYRERVRVKAAELVSILGDAGRIFEVGLRSSSCIEQHLIALEGCKQAGITRTSNVYGAWKLGLVPVGTMGHEHIQRYGSDDAAFRAMCERRPNRSSYLLDTFDTIKSGIPAALSLMAERPGEADSIRYDSGDKVAQYRHAIGLAKQMGLRPVQILEDSFDATLTRQFEALRAEVGWLPHEQVYGYGGYLVATTSGSTLTRDRVAAVYKLSQTGRKPTMKFGNDVGAGKQSVPGLPVLLRRVAGRTGQPVGIVAQEGEAVPAGYALLTDAASSSDVGVDGDARLAMSPATQALIDSLRQEAFGAA